MGFKVAFVHLLEQGHFQICVALGKSLLFRDPQNEVYFIVDEENSNKIKAKCSQFRTLIYKTVPNERIVNGRKSNLDSCLLDNEERFKRNLENSVNTVIKWKSSEKMITELIHQIKPHLVFVENIHNLPFIMRMPYKWSMIVSTNPLLLTDQESYPPICSGVAEPSSKYTNIFREYTTDLRNHLDKWYQECGLERKNSLRLIEPSPYLNVYLYPKPLNYFKLNSLNGDWMQLSCTIVNEKVESFIDKQGWTSEYSVGSEILSQEFLDKPGKLILISLGTIVSRNLELFEKLIPLLANCPHKFVISKGKFADQIELPANCVGSQVLNQLQLLPLVDLFITHGGNNSVSEACYFGVPMIIIPGYADQHDNACRLHTLGLARRIEWKNLCEQTLLNSIDYMLNNEKIKSTMKEISDQVRSDYTMDKLCDRIIELCSKN